MKDFISFTAAVLAALIFATSQLGDLQAMQDGKFIQASLAPAAVSPVPVSAAQ